jgi:hypothetical protein
MAAFSRLNNIGLYVRLIGKVTQIDPQGAYFYIDDGSGIKDNTKTGDVSNIGVRVARDGRQYTLGWTLEVNGISSCTKLENDLVRLIKVQKTTDIVILRK